MTKEEAKKMLTNTKVYVNGKSKEIQEKLFEIGFKWRGHTENYIMNLNDPFLFIEESITCGWTMGSFKNSTLNEISADDILNIKIDEGFKLKDGDIFYSSDLEGKSWISIFNRIEYEDYFNYADLCLEDKHLYCDGISLFGGLDDTFNVRLATEEEKNKLFSTLKENGYVWNGKTKEVEKINKEHEFNPFDKVLVRNYEDDNWDIEFFQEIGGEDIDYEFVCLSGCFNFCVPYEGNEELLGTSNSPKE